MKGFIQVTIDRVPKFISLHAVATISQNPVGSGSQILLFVRDHEGHPQNLVVDQSYKEILNLIDEASRDS